MTLLMQFNLLLPFQTSPCATWLRANPKAAGHVGALLMEACEGHLAEEPLAFKRFGSITMHLLTVIIEIESVTKVLSTGLTPEAVGRGWSLSGSLPSSPRLNNNLRLDWNQQVALISW